MFEFVLLITFNNFSLKSLKSQRWLFEQFTSYLGFVPLIAFDK
jgi:hypothetical protein